MRKFTILFALLMCFHFSASAQKNTRLSVVGIWQLTSIEYQGQDQTPIALSHIKIYNKDKTYMVVTPSPEGYFINHSGKYVLKNGKIKELITERSFPEADTEDPNDGIGLTLAEDGNTMTLKYLTDFPNSGIKLPTTEIWKRIKSLKQE